MNNFAELLDDLLKEKKITIKELHDNNILKKNVYYEFKEYMPSLKNAISIANYLKVSLDYIINENYTNDFKKYKVKQENFYKNLQNVLSSVNIAKNKMCNDLNISRNNLTRWKSGSQPKLSTLIQITDYLKCDIDDLLDHED